MAVGYFVNGRRVNPHAPGNLLSADAVTHLHGDDFMRTFGAEMFRRLPLEQQAAVVSAWAKANPRKNSERNDAFETLLTAIFAAA
ncbi:hypothetical protein [Paraburkholderia metrosideri]|uniref:Uncharacterized protein n=1 Tax=Paraburkholderia metrosideri TaxID=580937 RepID=A0ABM8NX89_9BURK|nr:hypothetical protein [Paraburkholderia metrosideri]CAD6547871.1 hypothetical protein LMG28140_04510 [Paraburkholderia metrosideri]